MFDAKDQDHYDYLRISHTSSPDNSSKAPFLYKVENGKVQEFLYDEEETDYTKIPARGANELLWVRVSYDGSAPALEVRCDTSENGLNTKAPCFSSTAYNGIISGGMIGFAASSPAASRRLVSIDELTVETDRDNDNDWHEEYHDDFERATSGDDNGFVSLTPTYDAAGNMTFDGVLYYAYDAWNRMVIVRKDNSEYKDESLVARYSYDGVGRRILKEDCQLDKTYPFRQHYYYDGQTCVDIRGGRMTSKPPRTRRQKFLMNSCE